MATVFRDKITDARIKALQKAAERSPAGLYLFDTELQGLGCRVSPTNRRGVQTVSWVVQRYEGSRLQRAVFGKYPAKSVVAARKEALKRLAGDEHLTKQNQAKRDDAKTTLGGTVERYLAKKAQPGRYWYEVRQMLERDLVKPLGRNATLKSITSKQLREIIEAKPAGMARFLYAVLRPFFRWCVKQEDLDASPLDKVEVPKPPKARDRVLTDPEIKAFWEATEAQGIDEKLPDAAVPKDNTIFNPFHRLCLLTAQRREEVGALRWSELDLEKGVWVIPKERTKNGKEHLVHLSKEAIAVLTTIPRSDDCPFVFSGSGETSITGYSKAKARLDKRLHISAWRVHDLRRTAASGMAELGFQPHVIERVLNHISGAQGGLVGVYQRHEYLEERKRAIEAWGTKVAAIVSGKAGQSNVVSLSRVK